MCVPTARATAPTLSNVEHLRLEHTLNVRELPTVGGPAGDGAGTLAAVIDRVGAGERRARAPSRRKWSDATALGPRGASVELRCRNRSDANSRAIGSARG